MTPKPFPYELYLALFTIAVTVESRAIWLRNWAQRRKMACITGENPGRGW